MTVKARHPTRRRTLTAFLASSGAALGFLPAIALTKPETAKKESTEAERQIVTDRPCFVTVEFTARPGESTMLVEALKRALPLTRAREGCVWLELVANPEEEDDMTVVMLWRTRADYDVYRAWREANGDISRFERATLSGLKTRFFNTVAI